jgi:hypothetical protein
MHGPRFEDTGRPVKPDSRPWPRIPDDPERVGQPFGEGQVGGHHIRPTCRQTDQIPGVIVEVDAVFTQWLLIEEQRELATEPGMMGMGDAKTSSRYVL